ELGGELAFAHPVAEGVGTVDGSVADAVVHQRHHAPPSHPPPPSPGDRSRYSPVLRQVIGVTDGRRNVSATTCRGVARAGAGGLAEIEDRPFVRAGVRA